MKRVNVRVMTIVGPRTIPAYESETPGLVVHRLISVSWEDGHVVALRYWSVTHGASGLAAVYEVLRRSCALALAKRLGETGVDWTLDYGKRLQKQLRAKQPFEVVRESACWQRKCGGRHD